MEANSLPRHAQSTSSFWKCKRSVCVFPNTFHPQLVETFQLSIEAIKPGVHWDTIQLLCHKTLIRGFQKLGLFYSDSAFNSEERILASGISTAFFPHGVGHSLGLDVHDVPSASKPVDNPTIPKGPGTGREDFYTYLRVRLPLEKGMVLVSHH